jgi:hypothetical protein
VPISIVGEFECTVDDPKADIYGAADACWAMWAHYTQPKALLNSSFMTQESKDKMKQALDALGEAGLKARAEKRHNSSGQLTFPQPFSNSIVQGGGGLYVPNFYLVIIGKPVFITDKDGKATGVDPEKTKFFGRPEDHAMLALTCDIGYDAAERSVGEAIGYQPDIAPGYLLYSLFLGNSNPYEKNAQGVQDFSRTEMNILGAYWGDRQGTDTPPKKVVENLYIRKDWDANYDVRNIYEAYEKRAKSILENPVSQKQDFLTPELNFKLARLETRGLIQKAVKDVWKQKGRVSL